MRILVNGHGRLVVVVQVVAIVRWSQSVAVIGSTVVDGVVLNDRVGNVAWLAEVVRVVAVVADA